jgi:hypothetical protein
MWRSPPLLSRGMQLPRIWENDMQDAPIFAGAPGKPLLHAEYVKEGYVILRDCIALVAIQQMRSILSAHDLRQRKPDLMGDTQLLAMLDALVRPLFQAVTIDVERLIELSALIATNGKSVKLGWHKDRPATGGRHAFQLPLLNGDAFHELVPGSHDRALTEAEVTARNAGGDGMPGAISIKLDRGDILLRSPFVLHRGYNPQGVERLTLVGTYL